MIIEFMAYTAAISLLLGLAALAIERAFALAAWPRRWLWIAAMVVSLSASATMSLWPHVPRVAVPSRAIAQVAVPAAQPLAAAPMPLPVQAQPRQLRSAAPLWPVLENYAGRAWLVASALLLGFYLLGALRLLHARRQWPRQFLGRHAVLIAPSMGPAVFGLLRPAIVVPRWLLDQTPDLREAALLHEERHIAARDPALLLAALLLLALTPWNLPLWRQLRRLRLAIEVDCDSRVLRTGMERRHYMDMLLRINQYACRLPLGAVAIVGRASQLERRVRAMTMGRPRHVPLRMAAWALAAVPLLVVGAQLDPPASAPGTAPVAPHARLGIAVGDFDVNTQATAITHLEHHGALVTYVGAGDVADRAGLKRGDVVVRFGQTDIDRGGTLVAAVARTAADARVPLVVRRGSTELHLTADFTAAAPPHPPFGGKAVDLSDVDALRDANMAIAKPQLRDELVRMARLDERLRVPPALLNFPEQPNTGYIVPIVPGARIDPAELVANVHRLREIIARYGWPTVSMVGVQGATAAGLIALDAHDDPGFQARVLSLMEPLLQHDEVPTLYYAMLFDTAHTPQRYGMRLSCKNGAMIPDKPIEDPQHLQQRRAALGLPKQPQLCVSLLDAKTTP